MYLEEDFIILNVFVNHLYSRTCTGHVLEITFYDLIEPDVGLSVEKSKF